VRAAGQRSDPGSDEALAQLCEAYWLPLYAFVRRSGHPPDEAGDLTQAYFTKLLEKNYLEGLAPERGRFRSFLLASVKHFLANEYDSARALKRGGGKDLLSLDVEHAEEGLVVRAADDENPETLFEKQWARVLLDRTSATLCDEMARTGKRAQFDRLHPLLVAGKSSRSYKELAHELDLTESAVKMSVHRMRRRFGELLREEISHTVDSADQVDDEVRYLFDILRR